MKIEQNKISKTDADILYEFPGGYACVKDNVLYIPAIMGKMGDILEALYKKTGITRMVFTAVMFPEEFKKHLKNIVSEHDEWFEEVGDYNHFIEIGYEPRYKEK